MKHETISFIFDDIRKENGLEGAVLIYAKSNDEWVGVFRYELEKHEDNTLKTKVAKVVTFNPMIALDEQFRYELTYFTKEIFPKTFTSNMAFSIPSTIKVKFKGFATQPKVDDDGKMVLGKDGKPIMVDTPFVA